MCGQGYTHCISFELKSIVGHKIALTSDSTLKRYKTPSYKPYRDNKVLTREWKKQARLVGIVI